MARKHEGDDELEGMRVVELDKEGRADRARKLAASVQVLEELKEKKKELTAEWGKKVKAAEKEVSRLAKAVNTGRELVDAQREMFDSK